MVLREARKTKDQREALKHAEKEERKKGAPAMVRWPLDEAGAGVFIRRGRVC